MGYRGRRNYDSSLMSPLIFTSSRKQRRLGCTEMNKAYSVDTFPHFSEPRSRGTADAEIKVPSVENAELSKAFPLGHGLGHDTGIHASPTAENSVLSVSTFLLFVPKPASTCLTLGVANSSSRVGLRTEIGHPARR